MQRTFSRLTFPLQRSKPSPERHRGSHAVFLSHHNTARYSWLAGTLRNGARSFDRKSLRVGRQRASLDQPSRTPCVRLLDLPSRYTRTRRPVWYPQSLCLSRKTPRVFSTHLPDQLATRATLSVAQTTLDRETRRIAARHPPALALQLLSPVPCLMSVAASVTRRGQPQLLRPGRAALARYSVAPRCRSNYLRHVPKRSGFFQQARWAFLVVTSVQLCRAAGRCRVPCSSKEQCPRSFLTSGGILR